MHGLAKDASKDGLVCTARQDGLVCTTREAQFLHKLFASLTTWTSSHCFCSWRPKSGAFFAANVWFLLRPYAWKQLSVFVYTNAEKKFCRKSSITSNFLKIFFSIPQYTTSKHSFETKILRLSEEEGSVPLPPTSAGEKQKMIHPDKTFMRFYQKRFKIWYVWGNRFCNKITHKLILVISACQGIISSVGVWIIVIS